MLSYSPVEKSKSSSLNLLCFACIAFFVFVPDLAYCAGLGSAEKLLTKVSEWLKYLAVATVTVAILVVGYKVIFGGQTIPDGDRTIAGLDLSSLGKAHLGILSTASANVEKIENIIYSDLSYDEKLADLKKIYTKEQK